MSNFAALLLALASTAANSGTLAKGSGHEYEFVIEFTDICMINMGNADAQTSAVSKSKLQFAKSEVVAEGLQMYLSGKYRLGIGRANDQCVLSTELGTGPSLESLLATMADVTGATPGQPFEGENARYWILNGPNKEEFVMVAKISPEDDHQLGTLWLQRRSTLSKLNDKAN